MKSSRYILLYTMLAAGFLVGSPSVLAQQTTGMLCSPSETTTVDGKYLPSPPSAFGGVINMSAKDSKPCWPLRVVPPKWAPNDTQGVRNASQ